MTYERILVPLDGSQMAEYILGQVTTMATKFDSVVTILHVVDAATPRTEDMTPSQKSAQADIAHYVERVAEKLEKSDVSVEWHISYGEPASGIIRHATTHDVDLVMMSTHGKGNASEQELGSVALSVISRGQAPVMAVKPPEDVMTR